MKLVADANILFSLAKTGSAADEIFKRHKTLLCSPEYVLSELENHKKELEQKIGLSYPEIIKSLKERVVFISEKEYMDHLRKAESVLTDKYDAPYLALAMKRSLPIWSNDSHLKEQSEVLVFTTKELVELLSTP